MVTPTSPARSLGWCLIACALSASPVLAQDRVGNALNPQVISSTAQRDPDGLGITEHPRTPTGRLHVSPKLSRDPKRSQSGWLYDAHVEFGGLGASGDTDNAKFREYKDVGSGAYLNSFGVAFEKPDAARFLKAYGGGLGRNDQFIGADVGTYNVWRIRGFFTEIPHLFTSTYRSLWSGLGTDTLTLRDLPAGGGTTAVATQAAIQAALAATPFTDVGLTRRKLTTRLDLTLPDGWKAFATYGRERREGSRPFGLVFGGGGGGGNVEPPESVDSSTTDVGTGVHVVRGQTQFTAQAYVSLFRNDIDILSIENPLFVTLNTITGLLPNAFTQARYDLHPDNAYYNVRGEVARRLPQLLGSRVTGVVSISRLRQNDALVPWTTSSLTGGTINGVAAADVWNSPASLTRTAANARIDTTLVDVGWSLKPMRALDVRAKFRVFDTDNNTEFWACNPLTGQWGRLTNDGTGGAFVTPNVIAGNNPVGTLNTAYNTTGCDYGRTQALGLVPSAGNVNIRNVPFAHRQVNAGVTAAYRIDRHNNLEVVYERETFRREHREREKTWEDTARVTWAARGFDAGTLRLSYAYGRRRGSTYVADPYEAFLSGSFGPAPVATGTNVASWMHIVEQFRKFDLADRNRHTADARFNVALAPALDAGIAVQVRDLRFPASTFGRTDRQRQVSPTVDLTWQPTVALSVSGFASVQQGRMRQVGLQPNGCIIGNSYFFFSNGAVLTNATGVAPPAPAGTSLVATELVQASNWLNLCGTAAATSPLYPLSRVWENDQRDRNSVVGLTAHHAVGDLTLSVGYTFGRGRTTIDYNYNPAALAITEIQAAQIGDGWADLVFDQHLIDSDAVLSVGPWAALHFIYRYEHGRVRDWHYDGVEANPVPATNAVYLDAGPRGYGVHLAGVFVRLDVR